MGVVTRRDALKYGGTQAGGVGLSGCLQFLQSESMTDTTPASPAPTCNEGFKSLEPWWIVKGSGPLAGFELQLDSEIYSKGDTLIAKFRNVTNQKQAAGNRHKYDVQFRGPNGWHTIIGVSEDEGFAWTDEGYLIQPGNGWTWRLTLTETGIWDGEHHGHSYRACQPLKPGTYRFVYWGITTEQEREEDFETDYALGVAFTVT